ncbi:MAG: efflux RND transporter periplasmic adaptor subunit [Candidatus Aminicenantes bacterium]|nr:MAG: efflux RND transporter periplasmic adaptor subunit [Candidatus Aminicenantes bacterium]
MLTVLFFSHCSKEEAETKNIEQIYKEEGVPVRVMTLALQEFASELSFHSVLSGIQESSAYASFSDEVEKIHVRVGDYVKKNSVLMTFPTDNPATRYYQAKIAFENSKTAYERVKNLYNDGGISRQELDNAAAGFQVAQADWEAVQQTVKVRAPISGYVTKVNVRETDNVQRDDELFTISKTDKMKAKVWVSENEVTDIKKGQVAYAIWKGTKVKGETVQVDIAMDQEKQAFQVVMEFENPNNILKAGTTVEVKITTYINPEAIVVKRQNILKEEDSFYVYVLTSGSAERRNIKMGRQQVLDVEILDGLNPGDVLIVEGQVLLEHGAKVKVIK